jgi:GT2 family glycosyltransferase
VVIPVYNATDTILACLESLNEQEVLPYEVILIDNNSTDNTVNKVKKYCEDKKLNIILINEIKRGPAAARNKGFELSKGDVIAFTDSDCITKRDWIKNVALVFQKDPDLDVIGGVDVGSNSDISLAGKFLSAFWLAIPEKLTMSLILHKEDFLKDKFICTFNCAFKRKLLLKINGFDEAFYPAGEDIDIWMRALEQKAKIVCWEPNIAVFHYQNISVKDLIKKAFIYGEALSHLAKRHFAYKIILQIPRFGQYEFDNRFFTMVICNNFTKLFLLFTLILVALFTLRIAALTVLVISIIYFFFKIHFLIKRRGYILTFLENIFVLFLFIARELAEEMGRIYGSLRHRVICL